MSLQFVSLKEHTNATGNFDTITVSIKEKNDEMLKNRKNGKHCKFTKLEKDQETFFS